MSVLCRGPIPAALLLFGCSQQSDPAGGSPLAPNEIRAEVESLDAVAGVVTAVPRTLGTGYPATSGLTVGSSATFRVEPGDFGYLAPGKIFRAALLEGEGEGGAAVLTRLWPDDPNYRVRFEHANRLLRRDTLGRGEDPTRSVGDYLPPFALFDQDGNLLTNDFFVGKRTVVNFIFTRCSVADMCPAATSRMKTLQNRALADQVPDVQFLSITLDPEHDVPGILKTYARAYGVDETTFRFGTGPKSVLDDLVRQFGLARRKSENMPLDHTMRTFVVNGRRQIIYQVPGKQWSVDDFLARLKKPSEQ